MGHVDDRALAATDPAAHPQPRALERCGGDTLAAKQAQRLGREAQAESGAPVGAEIDEELALDHGGVDDFAFDDLEAAGIAPGLVGLAHGIEAVAPDAAPRLQRPRLARQQLGNADAVVGGAGDARQAAPDHLALHPARADKDLREDAAPTVAPIAGKAQLDL